jgi:hypothetical protein
MSLWREQKNLHLSQQHNEAKLPSALHLIKCKTIDKDQNDKYAQVYIISEILKFVITVYPSLTRDSLSPFILFFWPSQIPH